MSNRTRNSNRNSDGYKEHILIPWFGIVTTTLIVCIVGYGIWASPNDAEQAELRKAATLKNEQSRNAELKQTPGMEDCTFHDLGGMSVVRCPNSNTTTHYQCGKGCFRNNTTVDQEKQ